jgi:hypothetical protein
MGHYWMQTEGVFGVALGVSTSMIFLFVLFGALLEKAGGGNWFIKVAIALLGALRGGPAKAAGFVLHDDRHDLRFLDCEHSNNRHVHDPIDETDWVYA